MLRKVLLKVLTWHTRPLLIWLESIFLESLGTTTGPVPCCTKQLTAYPTHCVFLGLHCCWWFFLSWNSLPKHPISHISTHSLRMWLGVTCSGKPYLTYSRNSAFFTPCFLTFWVALCLRGGAPLLWAHRRWEDCAHRRGGAFCLFFLPRPFKPSPHCCWWIFQILPSLGQDRGRKGKRSREVLS